MIFSAKIYTVQNTVCKDAKKMTSVNQSNQSVSQSLSNQSIIWRNNHQNRL